MHSDRWRSERVFRRENEAAPILSSFIRGVWSTGDNVMPFQDICLGWVRHDVRRRIRLYVLIFSRQALVSGFGGHDGSRAKGKRRVRSRMAR
jgi:hypothetical protein